MGGGGCWGFFGVSVFDFQDLSSISCKGLEPRLRGLGSGVHLKSPL